MTAEDRRVYGCAGGEIVTSTSTNLRKLRHSTLTQKELSLGQQKHQYLNLTKNLNIYKDLNKNQNEVNENEIVFNKFKNFGEFKIWFV